MRTMSGETISITMIPFIDYGDTNRHLTPSDPAARFWTEYERMITRYVATAAEPILAQISVSIPEG